MKHYLLIAYLFFFGLLKAQDYKRTQNWYFGDSAGLSFATEPPTILTDGIINTLEGCASISDSTGNLLFYTNGITVWNKNHQIMENGNGLNAALSSTQAVLIVPLPNNDSFYYIFTTDQVAQSKGLQYSLININHNNGLGKVIEKNTPLLSPVCEKLTATFHNNGVSVWVVAHGWNNNYFYSYLITDNGLINCPIISKSGSIHGGASLSAAQGAMKFSPSGRQLAVTLYTENSVELFSFDAETGVVKKQASATGFLYPYGIEFSPKEKYLYVTSRDKKITQLSLLSSDINNSKSVIYNSPFDNLASMQLSQIGKIYLTHGDSTFLSVINSPDSQGLLCNFEVNKQSLSKRAKYGLPNFITTYFYTPKLDFTYTTNCKNDSIYFASKGGAAYLWQLLYNQTIIHTSNQATTRYNFADTGEYVVKLISVTDTASKTIYIEPKLELGKDTTVCNQEEYKLILPPNHRCLNWQDGSDSLVYAVTNTGKYYVSAYNTRGCLVSDTIKITFSSLSVPVITKRHDTLLTDSGNYTYKWRYNGSITGGNSHFIKISQNGTYRVEITDSNGCTNTSMDFPVTGLGIGLLKADNYFSIYPIPVTDKLYVQPNENIIIESLILWDITGRTLAHSPTTELSVQGLSKGIYLLEIIDNKKQIYTTKIIIH